MGDALRILGAILCLITRGSQELTIRYQLSFYLAITWSWRGLWRLAVEPMLCN